MKLSCISLRIFCVILAKACSAKALGMENEAITSAQLSQSRRAGKYHGASSARLNNKRFAWVTNFRKNEWLQVDFKRKMTVTAIATQGHPLRNLWVKKYRVAYKNHGKNFHVYEQNGKFRVNVTLVL